MRRPAPEPVGPGQESVWDYPRPPALAPSRAHVVVEFAGRVIVDTRRAVRVLETSHPPSWYLPIEDVEPGVLRDNPRRTFCEFKGAAAYFDIVVGDRTEVAVAWTYPHPTAGYEALRGLVAVYPGRMDRCLVDGVVVRAVQGDFYGGWVTPDVVGPFKGEVAGSNWW